MLMIFIVNKRGTEEMFYQEEIDRKSLRFGDVLKGYIATDITIKEPLLSMNNECHNYKMDIELPDYSAVLTPCCSIGDNLITLAPLIKLRSNFFKNPYFVEDFTIINRVIDPEKAHFPDEWEKLSSEYMEHLKRQGPAYTLLELFIYGQNDLFPKYELRNQETNYYMIDFRKTYKLKCDLIIKPKKTPVDSPILQSKCLQLSIPARSELRDKMSYYYGRIPEEDKILED